MPSSLESRSTGTFNSITRKGRPSVEITLDGDVSSQSRGINTYTTLDPIEGKVVISADTDVRFDQIHISFIGAARTLIERPGYAGPTVGQSSAFHAFLRLTQPIEESQYPQPRVLEAGRKYSFPFTFVVPERLLPHACKHEVNHPQIQAAHTHLPPSLGGHTLAGRGASKLLDDMCPQMCQIQYKIRARVARFDLPEDQPPKTLVEVVRKVRIVPATDEEPPLDVADSNEEFRMRSEKIVKKGTLRKKFGRIAVAAAQPKPFRLPSVHSESSENVSPATMATLHVRFDPDHEHQTPPKLGCLWTKLKVNTFFGIEPWSDFPSRSSKLAWNYNKGVYTDTLCLASRCVASATWQKHTTSAPPSPSSCSSSRRSSIQSNWTDGSLVGPTACFTGNTYYTATVLVPISLPSHKAYAPTFHSCLISRTYSLDISLSYNPSSSSTFTTRQTISLCIPVQVTGQESLTAVVANRAREASAQSAAADEFFTPRVITPPSPEYVGQARLEASAPPEYLSLLTTSAH
ncbi:hypothetical protein CISG_07791 [Coccidioides immitis RMSCC 3703]|uniref:Arrestin-like N-terminal domain-containing protein n=1 Tax=Coccidioides immitis RMSCC 3703 TaxID=454286 RepID=A0A0J8TZG1_COCIT|nr:hypothetical protein CISG_07791 [Coccidioides immitis RMSCC 3703]